MKAKIFLVDSIKGLQRIEKTKDAIHIILTNDETAMNKEFMDTYENMDDNSTRIYSFERLSRENIVRHIQYAVFRELQILDIDVRDFCDNTVI